jgi:protein-disulfide isomerase
LLFANQPAEGTAGLSDDELIDLGRRAGAGGDAFASCVKSLRYESWTKTVTDAASKDGVNGTPTVRVNGTPVEQPTPDNLRAAIEAAAKA